MKKTIFICTGNSILFLLWGLAFLFPFSKIQPLAGTGFTAKITIFPVLLIAYLIFYPTLLYIAKKRYAWGKKEDSELAFADEREKIIVEEAAKTAYKTLIGGIIACIAILGAVQFFSLFTQKAISLYFTSILLLTILLIIATIAYCLQWCIGYRK